MAIDMRPSYKSGVGYVDMFLHTLVPAIDDLHTEFKKVSMNVTIPASANVTQTIAITTDERMPDSSFDVFLTSTGDDAEYNFSTITQVEVKTNQLIVTRLYSKPTGSIDVTLVFYEKGD